jgi:hypothetical protein
MPEKFSIGDVFEYKHAYFQITGLIIKIDREFPRNLKYDFILLSCSGAGAFYDVDFFLAQSEIAKCSTILARLAQP